jgi:hypothetical protein
MLAKTMDFYVLPFIAQYVNSFDPGMFKTGIFLPITKANTYPMITYLPTYTGRHLEVNCEVEILGVYRIVEPSIVQWSYNQS